MGSFDCIMFFVCIFQAKVAIQRGATAVVFYVSIYYTGITYFPVCLLAHRKICDSCILPEDLPVLYFGSFLYQDHITKINVCFVCISGKGSNTEGSYSSCF